MTGGARRTRFHQMLVAGELTSLSRHVSMIFQQSFGHVQRLGNQPILKLSVGQDNLKFSFVVFSRVSVGAGITCQFSGCRGASLVVHADQGVPLRTLREAGAGSGDGSATGNGKLFLRRR